MIGPGYLLEFRDDNGNVLAELGPDDIMSPSIPQEHSVISEWEVTTPYNIGLEEFRHSLGFIFFLDGDGNRELLSRGPVDEIKSDDQSGETLIRGRNQIARLRDDGPSTGVVLADAPADEAIESVWDATDFDADVFGAEGETLSENLTIQDGSESFDADTAVDSFVTGSNVRRAQIGWTADAVVAENYVDSPQIINNDDYTGGEGVDFVGGIGEELELDITTEYSSDLRIGIRADNRFSGDNPGFELLFDGDVVTTRAEGTLVNSLGWRSEFVDNVAPGSHTFEVRGTGNSGDASTGDFVFDQLAVWDPDLTSADNEVHEPGGHLDSPHLYPTDVEEIRTEPASVESGSINSATVTTAIDDTSGDQRLKLFVDPGSSGADFFASNSETLGPVETPLTTTLQVGVDLAASDAVRDDATPRKGFEPQTLSSYELTVDTVDKIVFEDEEFTGNYFDILQAMHADAGLIFRPVVDEDQLRAETFERGAFADDVEWTRLGFERGFSTAGFANIVTAIGGEDENGDRPVAERSDDQSISEVGEEPAFVVNEQITTANGIENFAKAELNERLKKDEFAGELDIVPRRLKPGYRYLVDAFDGAESVLERVVFDDGRSPSGQLIFEDILDIAGGLSDVRDEARRGRR